MSLETTGATGVSYESPKWGKEKEKKDEFPPSIIIMAHGICSSHEMWKDMISHLTSRRDKIIYGGYFLLEEKESLPEVNKDLPCLGFYNSNLFIQKDLVDLGAKIKQETSKQYIVLDNLVSPYTKPLKKILKPAIKSKVESLLKEGKSVIFSISFSNNIDDYRKQGAELKYVIDFVRPEGRKVDILTHSMGSLATVCYISEISGVKFGYDIDQFVALGPPYAGSAWGTIGLVTGPLFSFEYHTSEFVEKNSIIKRLRQNPIARGTKQFADDHRLKGDGYKNIQKNTKVIQQMREAWNKHYAASGVRSYVLQGYNGDYVVDWASSFSLRGMSYYIMPRVVHTGQANDKFWQGVVHSIFAEQLGFYADEYVDLSRKESSDFVKKPVNWFGWEPWFDAWQFDLLLIR